MAKTPIKYYVTFDIETTGLKYDKHGLIEIACVAIDNNLKEVGTFESGVIKTFEEDEIVNEALKVNNITEKQIENGKDPNDVVKDLIQFFLNLSKKNKEIILCGHNIDKFDIPFLSYWFDKLGYDLSKYVNSDFTIDTMWWSHVMWNESNNFKLGTVCHNANIELVNAHRALNDTKANSKLVKFFINNLRILEEGKKEERFRVKFEF